MPLIIVLSCATAIALGISVFHGIRSTPAVTAFFLEHAAPESLDPLVESPPRILSRETVVMWQFCMVEASIAGMRTEDLPEIFRQQGINLAHPWGARLQNASRETLWARFLWVTMYLMGLFMGIVFAWVNRDDLGTASIFLVVAVLSVATFAWYLMRHRVTLEGRLVGEVLDLMQQTPQERRLAMHDLAVREIESGRVRYSDRGWPIL